MNLRMFLFVLLIINIGACNGSKKSTGEAADPKNIETVVETVDEKEVMKESGIKSLAVKRNACYGRCPTFEFTVDQTGAMTYQGKRFVEKLGLWKGQMEANVLRDVWVHFSKLDLGSYESLYKSGAMDVPISSLKIGRQDSIQVIVGDFSMPEPIKSAMAYLDSLGNSLNMELYEAKVPRDIVPGETIVNVKASGTPEEICQAFAEYGLKVKKKVSPALSLYVLTFDENKNAGRLLALLKKHPMVNEAQFNQNADQRNN